LTVFELMVVFAVGLVITIIFVASSREFIGRTRVMKVREEQALLKRALENYRVDYRAYPPDTRRLAALLAPTAYLVALPNDPFATTSDQPSYIYLEGPGGGYAWLLISPGPDGRIDVSLDQVEVQARSILAQAPPPGPAPGGGAPTWPAISVRPSMGNRPGHGGNVTGREQTGPGENPYGSGRPARARIDAQTFRTLLLPLIYDPTNGTDSAGDLVMFSDR